MMLNLFDDVKKKRLDSPSSTKTENKNDLNIPTFLKSIKNPLSGLKAVKGINPGINLRAAVINSNVSVSPRRYYHTYGCIIIHTTTSHTIVRVYNHE